MGKRLSWSLAPAAMLVCITTAPHALAQGRGGGARSQAPHSEPRPKTPKAPRNPATADLHPQQIERFAHMTPQEQQRVLENLPPDRRKKVQEQLQKYNQLSPEQKQQVREQYQMFQQLPPERQDAMRKAYRKFLDLPADRQQDVREEFQQLRGLSPEDRAARMNSPEFRTRFNKREQKVLEEMNVALAGK